MIILLVAIAMAAGLTQLGSETATLPIPAPVNLEVVNTTEDSITITWGPSYPSDFMVLAVNKASNAVTVGWKPSEDLRGPVTYDVTRNGVLVASNITATQWKFTGLKHLSSFRMCVTASAANNKSIASCGTVSRN